MLVSGLLLLCASSAAAEDRYVLSVNPGGAEVRVVLGGQLLRFSGNAPRVRTVNDLLRAGSNAVRLGWTNVRGGADLTISRLPEVGEAEVLFHYRVDGVLRPASGALTVAVVRGAPAPEPTAAAETLPGAKLSAFVSKGLVRLTLNGYPLGDCASFEKRDVSSYLHKGRNTLKVVWSKDFGNSIPSAEVRLEAGESELLRWVGPRLWSLTGTDYVNFEY